jgi:haloacetate dehalogenase
VRGQLRLGEEPGRYPDAIMAAYRATLDDPEAVTAMCEDYRAGATPDVADDEADRTAGRQIRCPTLVLWAAHGGLPKLYADVLDVWRPWAPDLRGHAIEAGHFIAEDRPDETAAAFRAFLAEPDLVPS